MAGDNPGGLTYTLFFIPVLVLQRGFFNLHFAENSAVLIMPFQVINILGWNRKWVGHFKLLITTQ